MNDDEILLSVGGGIDEQGRKYFLDDEGNRRTGIWSKVERILFIFMVTCSIIGGIIWTARNYRSGNPPDAIVAVMIFVIASVSIFVVLAVTVGGITVKITSRKSRAYDQGIKREKKARAQYADRLRVTGEQAGQPSSTPIRQNPL